MNSSTPSAPSIALHGIPNCDSVKKARQWLTDQSLPYHFRDFKKTPPTQAELARWSDALGWEPLLNRKGTTWRGLDAAVQAGVQDAASAIAVMLAHPSSIKRPVLEWTDAAGQGHVTVGLAVAQWQTLLPA